MDTKFTFNAYYFNWDRLYTTRANENEAKGRDWFYDGVNEKVYQD